LISSKVIIRNEPNKTQNYLAGIRTMCFLDFSDKTQKTGPHI